MKSHEVTSPAPALEEKSKSAPSAAVTTPSATPVAPAFAPSKTAKPVLAIKHRTSQPTFWLSKGRGTRQTPLSRGEHSLIFLTPADLAAVDKRADADKVQAVGLRARWINKVYQNYIKVKGCKQIIILGSGFDIRPYKKNQAQQAGKKNAAVYGQVKFYEVDSDTILDLKEKVFAEHKEDKNATYIRGDYTEKDFIEKLAKAGVDFKQPTLFIWEGNIYYLDKVQVAPLMERLKEAFNDFAITFDYFPQSFLEETRKKYPSLPWKTGIDDIQGFADQFKLKLMANQRVDALAKEYQVDENPAFGESHYVCTLAMTKP